jgi:hypothetical protein
VQVDTRHPARSSARIVGGRQHDHRRGRGGGRRLEPAQHLEAVHARHLQIEQDDEVAQILARRMTRGRARSRRRPEKVIERRLPVGKTDHAVRDARAAQVALDQRRMAVVVFDQHDADAIPGIHRFSVPARRADDRWHAGCVRPAG